MTTYYRVSDGALRDITQEHFASLAENKRADLRLLVIDPQPTPTAGRVVVSAGIVVGATEAHDTWAMRDKTEAELEDDALAAEFLQLEALLANIETQNNISNSAFSAMTTVQKLDVLRADRNHVLRAVKYMLRRIKRGGA